MDEKMNEMPRYNDDEVRLFNSLSADELDELGEVLMISLDYELDFMKGERK